jgi:hypothetical protein
LRGDQTRIFTSGIIPLGVALFSGY